MIHKTRSLVDELSQLNGKAEIVQGEIVRMSPAGGLHGMAALIIVESLLRHQRRHGGGTAFGDNVGFIVDLPQRESFSPDAAWHTIEPGDVTEEFLDGAPVFAVEVRSPDDYTPAGEAAILAKIGDYFAAGTLVVWDVNMRDEVIRCHRCSAPSQPQVFRFGEIADAEPAVPNWRFRTRRLKI
jgi:Uma2 family endonuclease